MSIIPIILNPLNKGEQSNYAGNVVIGGEADEEKEWQTPLGAFAPRTSIRIILPQIRGLSSKAWILDMTYVPHDRLDISKVAFCWICESICTSAIIFFSLTGSLPSVICVIRNRELFH